MPYYTVQVTLNVDANTQTQAYKYIQAALKAAKMAELEFVDAEVIAEQATCDNCGTHDDDLTAVCAQEAESRDNSFPGCDAVIENWCDHCVKTSKHFGIVRDEDPEQDPDRERDL